MNPIAVLLLCLFIDLVGFGIILPILPFIVQSFGGGELMGGLLFASYSLTAAFAGPLWGRLSDRIGRKRALMLTLAGASLSYVALGLAHTVLMIFLARAFSGAMAGNVGVVMAAMADLTSERQRTRAMGLIGVSFGLGFATGPGIAAVMATFAGADALAFSAYAAALLSLSAFILAAMTLPPMTAPLPQTGGALAASAIPGFRSFVDSPQKAGLMLQFVLYATIQSMVFAMSGFWASDIWGWNERQVGFLMTGVGVVVAALQGFVVAPLAERIGEIRTYLIALLSSISGSLLLVFLGSHLFATLLAFPLMMGGMTLAYPVLNSIVSRRHQSHVQGAALGLANGFSSTGRVVGPMLGGWLMVGMGSSSPFIASLALAMLGVLWVAGEIRAGRGRISYRSPAPPPATPQAP